MQNTVTPQYIQVRNEYCPRQIVQDLLDKAKARLQDSGQRQENSEFIQSKKDSDKKEAKEVTADPNTRGSKTTQGKESNDTIEPQGNYTAPGKSSAAPLEEKDRDKPAVNQNATPDDNDLTETYQHPTAPSRQPDT